MTPAASRTPAIEDDSPALRARLAAIWATTPGWRGWFTTVDHKEIGIRYIVSAFLLLAAGGIEALLIRLQLAGPDLRLLTPFSADRFPHAVMCSAHDRVFASRVCPLEFESPETAFWRYASQQGEHDPQAQTNPA